MNPLDFPPLAAGASIPGRVFLAKWKDTLEPHLEVI